MPIYEYQCQSCGHAFETMQRLADARLTACPQCEGPLKKLVSAPAFQFKGSGWYVTDYSRSGGGGKDSSGKEGGDKGGEKREGGSAESKPDSGPAESSATKIETPSSAAAPAPKTGSSSD